MVPFFSWFIDWCSCDNIGCFGFKLVMTCCHELFDYSHMILDIVDRGKLGLNVENHELNLRVISIVVDHHLDLKARWFLKINKVGTLWLFSDSWDRTLVLLRKIENTTFTTQKISYKVLLETSSSLDEFLNLGLG